MKKFLIAGLAILSAASAAQAATVVDGNFETLNIPNGPQYNLASGTQINGLSAYANTPDGVTSGFINSSSVLGAGSIIFNLTDLVVGQSYTVSFLDAMRTGVTGNTLTASYGNSSLGSFTASSTAWTNNTTSAFTATATTGTLSFTGATVGFGDTRAAGIDNVSISSTAAVPEPASWAMMVGGFGMLGGVMRRRQRPAFNLA